MIFSKKKSKNVLCQESLSQTSGSSQLELAADFEGETRRMPWEDAPDPFDPNSYQAANPNVSLEQFESNQPNLNIAPDSPVFQKGQMETEAAKVILDNEVVLENDKIAGMIVPVSNNSIAVEDDLKRRLGDNVKSALGAGTVIEGKFKFDSPVRIDGSLTGEVSSSSVLIVGQGAVVEGEIDVGSLIVLGSVRGRVSANELVEVRAGGALEADIETSRICIDDGAYFQGSCRIKASEVL